MPNRVKLANLSLPLAFVVVGTWSIMTTGCSGESSAPSPPPDAGPDALPSDMGVEVADAQCGFVAEETTDASTDSGTMEAGASHDPLRINEVMTGNDGAWVDELGETDDFIELLNTSSSIINLGRYWIAEKSGKAMRLPSVDVQPGKTVLLWADGSPEQGSLHLKFKLSAKGTNVFLWSDACVLADRVAVPALPRNESFARLPDGAGAFTICRYATPERPNGDSCMPPPPTNLNDDVKFAPYAWSAPFRPIAGPLVLTELALRPAAFAEVMNVGAQPVSLSEYSLRLAPLSPGRGWPTVLDGVALSWPVDKTTLAPGERIVVSTKTTDTSAIAATAAFEGAATIFHGSSTTPSDRVDFMQWPNGSVLTRVPDATGLPKYCAVATPGAPNVDCQPVASRPVGDRLRYLRTPHDFVALGEGGTELGDVGVKFVVDMASGDQVHLLGTRDWALHYTWVRERIYGEPHLDRCIPEQAYEFNEGWRLFSQQEYFRVEERRFLLGTLVLHMNGTKTVEFTPGDAISAEQMRRAFFAVTAHTEDPTAWKIRPTEARQIGELRKIEGTAPVVGPNAPYVGLTYQALTTTVGYGVLKYIPAQELETAELAPNVLVVTDDVPNDIALTGGLITEAFQTPLAHVNVLSRSRNTPNMVLRGAKDDPRIKPLFGQLVRLEVRAADFEVRAATPEEADAFWQSRKPKGPKVVPTRDLSVRGVVSLASRSYADASSIGSKAAGIAELYRVNKPRRFCAPTSVPLAVPKAFAIPFVHYVEHFEASGARALLTELEKDPAFRADPTTHAAGLARVRTLLIEHPVDPMLLAEVRSAVRSWFVTAGQEDQTVKIRLRSSSNIEDLATFNGAGLHTSTSAEFEGTEDSLEESIRTVWSSLWNTRAYDERDFGNIDQSAAAMAILVHQAWQSEAAQGVAISRNALHATRSDQYYINAQIGEATVTNPAPGITSDELVYTPLPREPAIDYRSRSNLSRGRDVLTPADVEALGCALGAVHDHFQPLVDPDGKNRLFAMQIEYKFLQPDRVLLVKQARPYTFGSLEVPQDCREF